MGSFETSLNLVAQEGEEQNIPFREEILSESQLDKIIEQERGKTFTSRHILYYKWKLLRLINIVM